MSPTTEQADRIERELRRRFRRLRCEESLSAPPCPEEPTARRHMPVATVGRGGAAGLAAALAALVVVALLAIPRPQSPEDLYRDIMNTNVLLTDGLLDVSPLALPEYSDTPRLYDVGAAARTPL